MSAWGNPLTWVLLAIAVAVVVPVAVLAARALPALMTPDGRRAWAFAAVLCGSIVFTLFAAVGVWLNRDHPDHSFWLALAAHGQVLIGLTCLGALLVKRTIRAGKDGLEVSDAEHGTTKIEATVTASVPTAVPPPATE